LHGMQEVGGSIPPGSTTLRPSGYAWRSHVMPEGRSVVGEDGLERTTNTIYHPARRRVSANVVRLHHPQY
jgi:hypothetical protein